VIASDAGSLRRAPMWWPIGAAHKEGIERGMLSIADTALPALRPGTIATVHEQAEAKSNRDSLLIAFYACAVILIGFIIASDEFLHWFVLPVLLCGILIGSDAVDWMRGRVSLLDPAGCVGLLGLHFFFLAPLLHVKWDLWMPYVTPPPDWRPWLGGMAMVNVLGLLVYRLARGRPVDSRPQVVRQPIWQIDPGLFMPLMACVLMVAAALQLWVYQQFGGILGIVSMYMETRQMGFVDSPFKGLGILFIVSESFPILAMMAFSLYAARHKHARSWGVLLGVFVVYFALLMLFGGLRGSRGNTLYSLVMGGGIIHLLVRPVTKKMMAIGCLFVIGFMYVFGFYKEAGIDALTVLDAQTAQVEEMERKTGRTFEGMILGDLGRSDVQAFILYRLVTFPTYYDYAWGRTYLGTAALLVPNSVWPERPVTKVKEGTEVMFGKGAHRVGMWDASNIYGLAGETMLNFGPFAAPFAFVILGWVVNKIRLFAAGLDHRDIRVLLIPFCLIFTVHVLTADSDNILWFTVKFGLVPFLVMAMGSKRVYSRFGVPQ
jgi:hypothetical protein